MSGCGSGWRRHYNHEHRHSGVGLHTPYSVHIGTAPAIQDKRQAVLNAAYAANQRRFTRRRGHPKFRCSVDQQAGHRTGHNTASVKAGSLGSSRTLCISRL